MFQLGKTIVSEDIIEKEFVCNLASCKGACCIEGEAGAPLIEEEVLILKNIYPKVKPYLRPPYNVIGKVPIPSKLVNDLV